MSALTLAFLGIAPTAAGAAPQRPAAASQTAGTGSVVGTVTDTSGAPIAGATVTVTNYYSIPEASATTAADGTYTVTGLQRGSSRVEFTASGYVTQWWNNQPDGAHSNTINVPDGGTATANATLALVGGLVTDANGPVAGATVAVFAVNSSNAPGNEISHTTTGSDGRYDLSRASGNYFVLFDPPAGSADAGQWYSNSPTAAGATQFTYTSGGTWPNAQLSPGPRGSISGTVADVSGNPLAGVTAKVVTADGTTTAATATTAADGTYTINNLDVGIDTVQFVPPAGSAYAASYWNAAVGKVVPLTVDQASTITGINAKLNNGAVTGTVTDTGGTPIAGATVTVSNYYGIPENSARTAADGTYTVTGLQRGSSRVQFTASGYVTQWWNNQPDITHSNTINVPDPGTATANATLALVGGLVTDANGPVAGATVAVFAVNSSNAPGNEISHTTTGANGRYDISTLGAGNYFVLFDPPAGSADAGQWYNTSPTATGATQFTYTSGGTWPNAQLSPGPRGSISGTVSDRSGNPIAGITAKAVAADGTTTVATATTAADGTYTINNVDIGIDTVQFVPPAGSSYLASYWNAAVGKVVPLTVDQGSVITGINGSLAQGGTLTGTVSGPSGPIAGATVTVANYFGFDEATAPTAADGTYTLAGLPHGSSRVQFTAPGYVTQWWDNQPDLAHSNTINVPEGGTATANATLVPSG